MFDDQVARLLRRRWPNATMLAEELYSLFLSSKLRHDGTFEIFNETNQPGLIVHNNPGFPTDNPRDEPPISQEPEPPLGEDPNPPDDGATDPPGTPSVTGIYLERTDFTGVVVSGSGSTYQVALLDWKRKNLETTDTLSGVSAIITQMLGGLTPADAAPIVTVTQLQIASGEAIPAGSWINPVTRFRKIKIEQDGDLVILSEEWKMQFTVWV